VELFLNNKSLDIKKKIGDEMHVMWRVVYEPGTLKAVSRKNGKIVMTKEIHTAGAPAKIVATADRNTIHANGNDLSFVTIKIVDKDGNLIPNADHLIRFTATGAGKIAGTDNGSETDLESFQAPQHKAFNGLCLAVIQSTKKAGTIQLTASADGLQSATISIQTK
jgi:beta-galactosidase